MPVRRGGAVKTARKQIMPTAPVPAVREIPATPPGRVVGLDGIRETER